MTWIIFMITIISSFITYKPLCTFSSSISLLPFVSLHGRSYHSSQKSDHLILFVVFVISSYFIIYPYLYDITYKAP
ncbi:uncharacterized protein EV154DRAFT_528106 [Mucor mucedo]|uniref:uncharacterized protein n=1 Tax=Mucor mucedo TaxID=29922 RepID=UPI00221E6C96|nr:uncharacterized protein EV154DRAFT_528106 [Mucor mucedo]KAI7873473.1 hypothetical protein EV154DRAFT_528106 [Mucor mucedo]